jgi:hypothetical protein
MPDTNVPLLRTEFRGQPRYYGTRLTGDSAYVVTADTIGSFTRLACGWTGQSSSGDEWVIKRRVHGLRRHK